MRSIAPNHIHGHSVRSTRPERLAGFTLVELLVVIAIIGMLIAMLLPAVQSAREAARLTQCKNHLKQISLATIQFHDTNEAYPPARLRALSYEDGNLCETTQPSWLVRILPFLEQQSLDWQVYDAFEDHPDHVREFAPAVFVCPTRRTASESVIPSSVVEQELYYACGCSYTETVKLTGGAVGDYAANHGDYTGGSAGVQAYWRGGNGTGVIISSRPLCRAGNPAGWLDKVRIKDIVDGTTHTALVGELHVPADRLAQVPENGPMYNGKDLPAFARIGGPGVPLARGADDDTVPAIGFGSWHQEICPFAMADGSVQLIDNFVDVVVLQNMCTRGEAAPRRVGNSGGAVR